MTFEGDYEVERYVVAQSCRAEIRRCTHRSTGAQRAVKIYHTNGSPARRVAAAIEEGELARELPAAPQLVRVYELYQEEGRIAITMELMERGSLFQHLSTRGSMPAAQARALTRHLLTGIALLHRSKVMHRDVKPENLFLRDTEDKEELVLAIGDFGFATRQIPSDGCVGSPQYTAPEVAYIGLQQHSQVSTAGARPLYNEKCDVWSAGVVAFVMLSGLLPFDGATPTEVFSAVVCNQVPYQRVPAGRISALAKAFIQSLMTTNPSKRPSAQEALRHPWLTN